LLIPFSYEGCSIAAVTARKPTVRFLIFIQFLQENTIRHDRCIQHLFLLIIRKCRQHWSS